MTPPVQESLQVLSDGEQSDSSQEKMPTVDPALQLPLRPHHLSLEQSNADQESLSSYSSNGQQDKDRLGASSTPAQHWSSTVQARDRWFRDENGRVLLMRGVNLCGASKLPTKPYPGSTHLYDENKFWDHRNVSFVGRPFPLEDVEEHFGRLRAWGLTLVRLLVPWESLEHAGPGLYDEEYIDYLVKIIEMMPKYGIKCFIDPHQDAWSRFSGGSGAPGWTFELAGLNIRTFKETGAAYVHNTNAVPGDPLPMVWPTNYTKLASSTMFTLFFGGDTFAPSKTYNGESIQQFLQSHFIDCFAHLAQRLSHLEAVLGFEVLNEPHPGYIGLPTLSKYDSVINLIFGDSPTPLQALALGEGIPQEVGVYVKSWPIPTKKSHSRVINQSKTSAWLEGHNCIWRDHGVWGLDANGQPKLLNDQYFANHPETGKPVSFYNDFYFPFVNAYARAIQSVRQEWFCFVEPLPNEIAPKYSDDNHQHNIVFAPHWYDLNCVFYKKFEGKVTHDVQHLQKGGNVIKATYFGVKGAKKNYSGQIRNIRNGGIDNIGEKPCVLGEVGIPMDLNQRQAFETGDYTHHTKFLDAVIYALESNLVNFTLWNYNPTNDNTYGDHWNGEDFSIYSPVNDEQAAKEMRNNAEDSLVGNFEIDVQKLMAIDKEVAKTSDESQVAINHWHKGGRVLDAVIRPYASKVAGTPISAAFNLDKLEYTFVFEHDGIATETEIYIPAYHYDGNTVDIRVSDGDWRYVKDQQTLYYRHLVEHKVHRIQIRAITSGVDKEASKRNNAGCVMM
ncbi:glycoside hydrolase superfamily [Umbelopsis sp. PMI_123]|nr:glycoside hydrolase superfamily [Umbelopsis sp. PMI_123]